MIFSLHDTKVSGFNHTTTNLAMYSNERSQERGSQVYDKLHENQTMKVHVVEFVFYLCPSVRPSVRNTFGVPSLCNL